MSAPRGRNTLALIEKPVEGIADFDELFDGGFEYHARQYVSRRPIKEEELQLAAGQETIATDVFEMRRVEGLTTRMRIKSLGKVYEITGITERDQSYFQTVFTRQLN